MTAIERVSPPHRLHFPLFEAGMLETSSVATSRRVLRSSCQRVQWDGAVGMAEVVPAA
jgi:hypothetical protein